MSSIRCSRCARNRRTVLRLPPGDWAYVAINVPDDGSELGFYVCKICSEDLVGWLEGYGFEGKVGKS